MSEKTNIVPVDPSQFPVMQEGQTSEDAYSISLANDTMKYLAEEFENDLTPLFWTTLFERVKKMVPEAQEAEKAEAKVERPAVVPFTPEQKKKFLQRTQRCF